MPQAVGITYSAFTGEAIYAGRSNGGAAGSLALVEFANQKVYQRVGTSKIISVAFTFTGSPALIQARVLNDVTSAVVVDWTTISQNPTGTSGAGPLNVPQGGWYRIELRCGVNTGLVSAGSNKFGVGMVIALIGQSNMHNRPSTGVKRPLGDVRSVHFNTSNAYARIGNINDTKSANLESDQAGYGSPSVTIQSAVNGDGFVYIGNLISQNLNMPVCIIERAVGGSDIASWMAGQTNWTTFAAAVAAAGGDFELCVLQLGESDANLMSTATMVTRLGQLQGQLKSLTGRNDSNLHFGIVPLGIGSYLGSSEGEFGNMRAAHVQYANNTAGAFLWSSAHDTYTSDGVHIVAEGFSRVDRRGVKSFLARLGIGVSGAGPRITGATRTGTTVTATVAHAGGSALLDGGGGNGAALTGFQFFDAGAAGAEISYTTSIVNSTIVFTLASPPVGALTMAYAMMNNPHSASATTAPTLSSVVYDNATYYNSTIGCPLQPLAAIAVA